VDELQEIVTEAGLVHQRDFYETSLSNLIVKGGDPLADLSTAYELAASLGIPEGRLESVIQTRYPSADDQLAALEIQGATATPRAVARTYQAELLRVLRQAMPSRQFVGELEKTGRLFDHSFLESKWRRDYTVKVFVTKESQVRTRASATWWDRVLRRSPPEQVEERRDDVLLGTIEVGNEFLPHPDPHRPESPAERLHRGTRLHIVITVGSGVLIKLCGDLLTELHSRFERHNGVAVYEVLYDYVVQEVDQLG
jgi:hypothetical protein